MKNAIVGCVLVLLFSTSSAQFLTRQTVASILGFENNSRAGVYPEGWTGSGNVVTDNQTVHSGKYSAHVSRNAFSSGTATTILVTIPLDFDGSTIEWRGYVRRQSVNGFVALWLSESDASGATVQSATSQGKSLQGSSNWVQDSVTVPSSAGGASLTFAFELSGTGDAWIDDFDLLVDGVPVAQAAPPTSTALVTDHQFDGGSGIQLSNLSDIQISNLVTLAKVWGFLKYHHPAIAAGQHQWDYDLFRVMPQVLATNDAATANAAISAWITSLGDIPACSPCATLNGSNLYLQPDIDWIYDSNRLGSDLSNQLQAIYANRSAATQTVYVGPTPAATGLAFFNEFGYGDIQPPDAGFQLLALFRFWNIVQYFYPDRDVIGGDPASSRQYWNSVLQNAIAPIGLAPDFQTYQLELMKLIAKLNDTHADSSSLFSERPPVGECRLPVVIRFVEGQPVVYRFSSPAGQSSGLFLGDVIQQADGVSVTDLIQEWAPYYADSNPAARLRDIAQYMTQGPCGTTSIGVQRGNNTLSLPISRLQTSSLDPTIGSTHDLPGSAFQMLTSDVAYIKISAIRSADVAQDIASAAATKGLIIDIRNYPSSYTVFTLGQLLVNQPTDFVRFTTGDTSNPGAMHWLAPQTLIPQQPHYSGKVVILVDEITQSSAEFHAMAFRTAPGSIVIGSTTAGADGSIVLISLPGGLSTQITGQGVFYPDGRPTQRVGIIPDIYVEPTIEGIRQGRDELIEEAIRQIEGPATESTLPFSLNDKGVMSSSASGISSGTTVGYGIVQPAGTSTPSALAIFGLTQNNVLVSEASVPATALVQNGRTYAEINASVNTGVAIANPSSTAAIISFYFSGASGKSATGTFSIAAKQQIATFLNQAPFNGTSPFTGTFTFSSSVPVAVIALRGLTNERGEFLITTLPIVDLSLPQSTTSLIFPHYADGAGWTTALALANSTDKAITGVVRFVSPAGGIVNTSSFSILPASSQVISTPGTAGTTAVGSVQVVPDANMVAPFGVAIFSFRKAGITVSQAGVPAVPAGTAFRLYTEASADASEIQTGIAVTNTSDASATVQLDLFNTDGSPTGLKGSLSIPAHGQTAAFLNQISGFTTMPGTFQGIVRLSSSASFSVVGLRGRYNERSDFLTTTIAPANEAAPPSSSPLYIPHLVVGGGYTTQLILLGGGSLTGNLSLFAQGGQPLNVIIR